MAESSTPREIVAKALALRMQVNAKRWPTGRTAAPGQIAGEQADVALAALADSGYVVLPVELSEEQIEAAIKAWHSALMAAEPESMTRATLVAGMRAALSAALRVPDQETR